MRTAKDKVYESELAIVLLPNRLVGFGLKQTDLTHCLYLLSTERNVSHIEVDAKDKLKNL